MLLGIIFITITLHKRKQSIQETSVKKIQQFSNEIVNFLQFFSVKIGAPAGGWTLFAETSLNTRPNKLTGAHRSFIEITF